MVHNNISVRPSFVLVLTAYSTDLRHQLFTSETSQMLDGGLEMVATLWSSG